MRTVLSGFIKMAAEYLVLTTGMTLGSQDARIFFNIGFRQAVGQKRVI